MELSEMSVNELNEFLDEVQDDIENGLEMNKIASNLVNLVDKKNQIEEELKQRLKYIEKSLK